MTLPLTGGGPGAPSSRTLTPVYKIFDVPGNQVDYTLPPDVGATNLVQYVCIGAGMSGDGFGVVESTGGQGNPGGYCVSGTAPPELGDGAVVSVYCATNGNRNTDNQGADPGDTSFIVNPDLGNIATAPGGGSSETPVGDSTRQGGNGGNGANHGGGGGGGGSGGVSSSGSNGGDAPSNAGGDPGGVDSGSIWASYDPAGGGAGGSGASVDNGEDGVYPGGGGGGAAQGGQSGRGAGGWCGLFFMTLYPELA